MGRTHRRIRRFRIALAGALSATLFTGCLDTDLAKRFREGYLPGFVEGLSTAVLQPGDSEAGLRRAWAALFEGIGNVVQPRTASGSSGSGSRRP